jgi:hypothetical protein
MLGIFAPFGFGDEVADGARTRQTGFLKLVCRERLERGLRMKHGGEMLQSVPGHHSQHGARFGRLHGQEHGGEECGVALLRERGKAHASLSQWSFEHEAGEGVVE